MKAKRLIYVLVILLLTLVGLTFAACPKQPVETILPEGQETGTYYYEENGIEHIIALSNGDKFSFIAFGENKAGTYKLEEDNLTLTFYKKNKDEQPQTLQATYNETFISLDYNDKQIKFLKKVTFKVSFDTGAAQKIEDIEIINGKTVSEPLAPTLDGYKFMGWYADENYTTPFAFDIQKITKDTTIYARFIVDDPTVPEYLVNLDFNMDGEENISMQTIGGKLYDLPTPTRSGYEFKGWWLSHYENANKLSYKYQEDMVFEENTTLYAYWHSIPVGNKFPDPVVRVEGDSVIWEGIVGAIDYELDIMRIVSENEYEEVLNISDTANSQAVEFSTFPAGDYVITLKANAPNSNDSSEKTIYYKNKALPRVSHFSVTYPSILYFNDIKDATNYYISIDVGDELVNLVNFDNGKNNFFDFANFPMPSGGIKFTVTAFAPDRAAVSRSFVYNRVLDKIQELYFDQETETVYWNKVPNATNYIVSIASGNSGPEHEYIDIGNNNSYCLKEHSNKEGGIIVKVYPRTKGWNSPEMTILEYHKTNLAAPKNIRLKGRKIIWDSVSGATGYEIKIGSEIKTSDINSYELPLDLEITNTLVAVRAKGENDSLWSSEVVIRDSLLGSLHYINNTVSWNHVVDAVKYEVYVNNILQKTVEEQNYAKITLTTSGDNIIEVRAYLDQENYVSAKTTVYAHTIRFDTKGGKEIIETYYAVGDTIELPQGEKDGYDFGGWYISHNQGYAAPFSDKKFVYSGDITLFASWQSQRFTVYYSYEGGIGDKESKAIEFGEEFFLDVPTIDDGRLFAGWYTDTDGKGQQLTDEFGNGLDKWDIPDHIEIYAFWADALEYKLVESGGVIKGWMVSRGKHIKHITTVVIPAEYHGDPDVQNTQVIEIDARAFMDCSHIKKIVIPDTIVYIGENAFTGCTSLQEIVVDANNPNYSSQDGVLFGYDDITNHTSILFYPLGKEGAYNIPSFVTAIGANIFTGNQMITELFIPNSITLIGSSSFANCTNLEKVVFEEGRTELEIGPSAFLGCEKLSQIVLPSETKSIGEKAFQGCISLKTISIPAGITLLANSCFKDTGLESVEFEKGGTEELEIGTGTDGSYVFQNCVNLFMIEIPARVVAIGNYAFANCINLAQITFEESGETVFPLSIGLGTSTNTYVFQSCISLQQIKIPARTTRIGRHAFSGCINLRNIEFEAGGESLSIGQNAFYNCGLISITLPKSMTTLENINLFTTCPSLEEINVESGHSSFSTQDGVLFNAEKTTLIFCPRGKQGAYTLPDTVKTINSYSFEDCAKLTSVTIPTSVTSIGTNAFSGCESIKSITFKKPTEGIGNSLTINNYAFAYCKSMTSIEIPARAVKLGGNVLRDCFSLTSVTFEEHKDASTLEVGISLFINCTGLKSITLSERIKSLGNYSFQECSSLEKVVISKNLTSIGNYSFYYCNNLKEFEVDKDSKTFSTIDGVLYSNDKKTLVCFPAGKSNTYEIPEGITAIGNSAFGRTDIESVVIPSTVETIGQYAFEQCNNLTEIFIPNSVTYLGNSVFYNSKGIKTIIFEKGGDKPLTIDYYAFYQCSRLESVELPARLKTLGTNAFYNATSLKTIKFDKGCQIEAIANNTFQGCTSLTGTIVIPATVKNIGANAFRDCPDIVGIKFEEGSILESIGNYAFYGCSALSGDLDLPASLKTIGDFVFYGLDITGLKFAKESQITTIGSNAFATCSKISGELVIPASMTSIGGSAFSGCIGIEALIFEENSNLTTINSSAFNGCSNISGSVIIPKSLKTLGSSAFASCSNIEEIVFEEGCVLTSFGGLAFSGCSKITSIKIPGNVNVYRTSFNDCTSLTEIIVDETNTYVTTVDGVLFNKAKTQLIRCPAGKSGAYIIPDTVVSVETNAFESCSLLTSITIPNGVQSLKNNAFLNCSGITSILLPESVNSIGSYVFKNCTKLTEIKVDSKNSDFSSTDDGVLLSKDNKTIIAFPCGKKGSYTIPNTVEKINGYAFEASLLKDITISKSVKEIGTHAFLNSPNLSNIIFEDGITISTIAGYTFSGLNSLKEITIPKSVKSIAANAFRLSLELEKVIFESDSELTSLGGFYGCQSLKEIEIPASVNTILNNTFQLTGIEKIVIPSGVTSIPDYCFRECTQLSEIEIPSTITRIGTNAFESCISLTEIEIPVSVTTIGNYAFRFSGLTKIQLPSSIDTIGQYAFEGCNGLTQIVIPSATTSIRSNTFASCENLEAVSIPYGVTTIENNAFMNSGITSIEIPATVTSIGTNVFQNCTNLTTVQLPSGINSISSYLFDGCTSLISVNIPSATTQIGSYAFQNCVSLSKITLPYGVTTISTNAFAFSGLTEINIPSSVTTINNLAFAGCTKISSITIPSTVTSLNNSVFAGWTEDQIIYIPWAKNAPSGWSVDWLLDCNATIIWGSDHQD